ncbi:MAG: fructose 1,6-bisphosphatase [Candidatus Kerfeldbacteria bacterium]|nr:fructose 1,6-bisphosphatase [Candidatus Kerfeldbacteria bacterium]
MIQKKRLTLSVIKADVGSGGGHTRPSPKMVQAVESVLGKAITDKVIIDGHTCFTGDDLALIMSHTRGEGAEVIHLNVALEAFYRATDVAKYQGQHGAGQDLLKDATSGNLRGCGPGVAEISFDHDPGKHNKVRPSEQVLVFAADKCGPGAYNLPLFLTCADPMYNSGLLQNAAIQQGFTFEIIDMDHTEGDRLIVLQTPEDYYRIATLLRDELRFAIRRISSRAFPELTVAAVSADRLHNISGKYSGKDDPVAVVRAQGNLPATEEWMMPWIIGHEVAGGARGGHVMPLMPVAINTAVTGFYCLPVVSCLAFSVAPDGRFSDHVVDMFSNPAWDYVRFNAQRTAIQGRRQGFFGPRVMLPTSELEYGGIADVLAGLEGRFEVRIPTDAPAEVLAEE